MSDTREEFKLLREYKKSVAEVARKLYDEHGGANGCGAWCEEGYHEILQDLGLYEILYPRIPEPGPGSIVRHKSLSVAYIRSWAYSVDGGRNWQRTQSENEKRPMVSWGEIKSDVVVVLDVPRGAIGYDVGSNDSNDDPIF